MLEVTVEEFKYLEKNNLLGTFIVTRRQGKSKHKKHYIGGENAYILNWLRNNAHRTKNYHLAPPEYIKNKPQVVKARNIRSYSTNYMVNSYIGA
jgi:hypothetical protein